jgi:hypothetical protein
VQDDAHGRDLIIGIGRSDSLEHLIKGIRIGEDVMRGFPITMLLGITEARQS